MKKFLLRLIAVFFFSFQLNAQCSLTAGFTATPDTVGSMNYTLIGTWQGGNPNLSYFTISPGPAIYSSSTIYTFPVGGTYTICFYVADTFNNFPGCSASFCDTLTVGTPGSCGSYITTTNNGGGNYTLTATPNVPSNWVVNYNWSFGDGTSSTVNPANHTYATNGVYTVSVFTSASDPLNPAVGCSGTTTLSLSVQGGSNGGGTMTCMTNFATSNTGLNFSFYNQSYTNDSAAVITSTWYIDNNYFSSLANPTYTFTDSLMHTVCLAQSFINMSTGDSCFSSFCDSVGLGINPGGGGGGSNSCQAGFVLWQDTLNLSTYYGYNTSSGTSGMTYVWDFGDGSLSTLANPTHQYANPGIYTICLTITDVNCTSVYCDSAGVFKMMNPGMSQLIILPNSNTGIQNISTISKIQVSPNPLTENSVLHFESEKADQIQLQIVDFSGRSIMEKAMEVTIGKNNFSIPAAELSRGIYFLRVTNMSGVNQAVKLVR
jgi:hypothetical protein